MPSRQPLPPPSSPPDTKQVHTHASCIHKQINPEYDKTRTADEPHHSTPDHANTTPVSSAAVTAHRGQQSYPPPHLPPSRSNPSPRSRGQNDGVKGPLPHNAAVFVASPALVRLC